MVFGGDMGAAAADGDADGDPIDGGSEDDGACGGDENDDENGDDSDGGVGSGFDCCDGCDAGSCPGKNTGSPSASTSTTVQ
jgi:hypothetical protein